MTAWQNTYKGAHLIRVPNLTAYTYTTAVMQIDADGAPNAYHENDDLALDEAANAGWKKNGGDAWKNVLVEDPGDHDRPYRQPDGPHKGFFVSMTALSDPTKQETDTRRWVNADLIPYVVFPRTFHDIAGTGVMGDFVMAKSLANNKITAAIVADIGPDNEPLGEVSIALARALGGINPNPKNGQGKPAGPFRYVVFPRSHTTPKWALSTASITERAESLLQGVGGWSAIDALHQ